MIRFIGGYEHIEKLKELSQWICSYLGLENVKIKIYLEKTNALLGSAVGSKKNCVVRLAINNCYKVVSSALFHEMSHVYQINRGFLVQGGDYYIWRGSKYKLKDEDYYDSPWEVDARLSEEMLKFYARHHQRNTKAEP